MTNPPVVLASPRSGRTLRRRRLGLLAGILVVSVGAATLVGGTDDGVAVTAADAGRTASIVEEVYFEAAASAPAVSMPVLVPDGATSTTSAPSTSTTEAATEATTTSTTAEPSTTTSTEAPATTSSAPAPARAAEAPPTTRAPTTTAPPPMQAPATTPAPEPEPSSGGYAYDDPRSTQVWLDLAQCESGGNWAADTGNGYYGGLQFSLGSWESVGGTGYPHEHPRDIQIEMGRRLQARQGWGAWPHCSAELGLR